MRAGSRAGRWRGGAHVAHAAHGGGRACQGAGPRVVGKISRRRAGCGARRGKATGKIGGRRRTGTHPAHICRHAAPHAERTASGRGGGGALCLGIARRLCLFALRCARQIGGHALLPALAVDPALIGVVLAYLLACGHKHMDRLRSRSLPLHFFGLLGKLWVLAH